MSLTWADVMDDVAKAVIAKAVIAEAGIASEAAGLGFPTGPYEGAGAGDLRDTPLALASSIR